MPALTDRIELAATTNDGFVVTATVYYDPDTKAIRNDNGAALRVINDSPRPVPVTVTDNMTGEDRTVNVPSGEATRSAIQLAAWGIATAADVNYSLGV